MATAALPTRRAQAATFTGPPGRNYESKEAVAIEIAYELANKTRTVDEIARLTHGLLPGGPHRLWSKEGIAVPSKWKRNSVFGIERQFRVQE